MSPESISDNELVEVVDGTGMVQRVVPRAQMRKENLLHRCVYVAVVAKPGQASTTGQVQLSPECRLITHQRAASKDLYPGFWDIAFGGVCAVGEGWEASACRELEEEAGLSGVGLTELGPVKYQDADTAVVGRAFVAFCSLDQMGQQMSNPDGEVAAFASIRLNQLPLWLAQTEICPDSATAVAPELLRHIKK